MKLYVDELATCPTPLLGLRLLYPKSGNTHKWLGDFVEGDTKSAWHIGERKFHGP